MGRGEEVSSEEDPIDLLWLASSWRLDSEWAASVSEIEREEEPSHLNTLNSSGVFNIVDALSFQYVGCKHLDHDVGAVQANHPAPTRRLMYYFEMTVKNAGKKGHVAIGFTPRRIELCPQPGWGENSCGYEGVDGMIYQGLVKGENFGPKFTTGDTIGAGINYASQDFFFTKNGELVGTVRKNTKGPMFPTVAVRSQNEKVTVNFGEDPFLFNIEGYALEERTKQLTMIKKCNHQANLGPLLLRSYLLHYGYEETLNSVDLESGNSVQSADVEKENFIDHSKAYELNRKKIICQLVRNGEIDLAMEKLQEWFPKTVQNETNTICFLLCLQKYIEQIRIGDLEAALDCAHDNRDKFFTIKDLENFFENCIALLAYERPAESSFGYLLDANQLELVADAISVAILLTDPKAEDREKVFYSDLEKLLQLLTTCGTERRALLGDQGEAFHPPPVLHSSGSNPLG